ncbi:MAG: hypothetical protein ACRDBR_01510 [Metamycoplasmataceae bacterium]
MKTEKIINLINLFSKEFSISKAISEKIINNFIDMEINDFDSLINKLNLLKQNIRICQFCSIYSEENLCSICQNEKREKKLLILENKNNIEKIENMNFFLGKYFLVPLIYDKKGNKKIEYSFDFLNEYGKNFEEIIIGISNTDEGQYTISEILKKLNHKKITKLATGMPFGVSFQYVDNISFENALENRKDIK